jgi:Protein of unknown function (DUF2924).
MVPVKESHALLWQGYDVPEEVKNEISLLFNMSVNELRIRYREVMGYNMNSRNKDFLLRKIAWKLQANIFNDISDKLKRFAIENVDLTRLKVRNVAPVIRTGTPVKMTNPKPIKLSKDSRLPMPGALLTKNYNGMRIVVKVLEKGFDYNGEFYTSLSGIARKVTGTNWNGYKFFDL